MNPNKRCFQAKVKHNKEEQQVKQTSHQYRSFGHYVTGFPTFSTKHVERLLQYMLLNTHTLLSKRC